MNDRAKEFLKEYKRKHPEVFQKLEDKTSEQLYREAQNTIGDIVETEEDIEDLESFLRKELDRLTTINIILESRGVKGVHY
ncbi:MAG: hypothetical protein CL489_10440 [Acidobacteria bacterium]|nr:hypothetical protein [Acidobacteriota bacterium]|tara:strand:+ start:1115 stop:1357 length:243 start_codon:yes stop_codon:yes gene_type:complete